MVILWCTSPTCEFETADLVDVAAAACLNSHTNEHILKNMYSRMEIEVPSPNVSQIVIPLRDHKVIGHKKTNITLPVIANPKKSVNSADSI